MIKNLNYCNYSYLFLLFLKYQAQFWKSNFSAFFFQSWLIILKVFWINNHIEFPLLNWMNIFWMNILDFVLNWILNWIIFRPDSMKKWIFKKDCPPLTFDLLGLRSSAHYCSSSAQVLPKERPSIDKVLTEGHSSAGSLQRPISV